MTFGNRTLARSDLGTSLDIIIYIYRYVYVSKYLLFILEPFLSVLFIDIEC